MIIRGGENIQPTEIENFICSMDQVQDCYVIGVPSKRLGKLNLSRSNALSKATSMLVTKILVTNLDG